MWVPKLGWVNTAENLRFVGKVTGARITRTADWWFLSVTVEVADQLRGALAHVGSEVTVEVEGQATLRLVLDELEARYPMLRGTIRDHVTLQRRPFLRFFACEQDLSHDSPDAPLPDAIVSGKEPLIVLGAIAGG